MPSCCARASWRGSRMREHQGRARAAIASQGYHVGRPSDVALLDDGRRCRARAGSSAARRRRTRSRRRAARRARGARSPGPRRARSPRRAARSSSWACRRSARRPAASSRASSSCAASRRSRRRCRRRWRWRSGRRSARRAGSGPLRWRPRRWRPRIAAVRPSVAALDGVFGSSRMRNVASGSDANTRAVAVAERCAPRSDRPISSSSVAAVRYTTSR